MNNLYEYIENIEKKAPEYLALLLAETDSEFDIVFDSFLLRAISHLEKNKKNFEGLSEEGLSAVLAGAMSIPGLDVSLEANSNGHVDITFRWEATHSIKEKLAEAKIWHGEKYHIKGLEQLVDRYTTGRECRGIVISYVKQPKIKNLFEKLKEYMNQNKPCNQLEDCKEHNLKWSFLSKHEHSSGEEIEVCHIGCNLY